MMTKIKGTGAWFPNNQESVYMILWVTLGNNVVVGANVVTNFPLISPNFFQTENKGEWVLEGKKFWEIMINFFQKK